MITIVFFPSVIGMFVAFFLSIRLMMMISLLCCGLKLRMHGAPPIDDLSSELEDLGDVVNIWACVEGTYVHGGIMVCKNSA